MLKNSYVADSCFGSYNPDSSLKERTEDECRSFHERGNLHMYPYVSGEFTPVERQKKR